MPINLHADGRQNGLGHSRGKAQLVQISSIEAAQLHHRVTAPALAPIAPALQHENENLAELAFWGPEPPGPACRIAAELNTHEQKSQKPCYSPWNLYARLPGADAALFVCTAHACAAPVPAYTHERRRCDVTITRSLAIVMRAHGLKAGGGLGLTSDDGVGSSALKAVSSGIAARK